LHARLQPPSPDTGSEAHCELGTIPSDRWDTVAENRKALQDIEDMGQRIAKYDLILEPESCKTYAAHFGDTYRPYRLCRVRIAGER